MKKLNVCKAMKGICLVECIVVLMIIGAALLLGAMFMMQQNNKTLLTTYNEDCTAAGGITMKTYNVTTGYGNVVCIST